MKSIARASMAVAAAAAFAGCASSPRAPGAVAQPAPQSCQAIATANAAFDEAGSPASAKCDLAKSLKPPTGSLSDLLRR